MHLIWKELKKKRVVNRSDDSSRRHRQLPRAPPSGGVPNFQPISLCLKWAMLVVMLAQDATLGRTVIGGEFIEPEAILSTLNYYKLHKNDLKPN